MKVQVLGSGREVGRSAILVDHILLDAGVKIQPEPPSYPLGIGKIKPRACIISHAHLDHSGASPIVAKKADVYMNDVTLDLSELLLRDSIKIAKHEGYKKMFSANDIHRMGRKAKLVEYNRIFRIGKAECRLYDAGHIPGSSGILVENEKRLFYTGDIQTIESHLLHKAHVPKNVDCLVIESTYALRSHPDRKKEEQNFLESVDECLNKSGNILLPSFAVGRSQELLLVLDKFSSLTALDGMARSATEIISYYRKYIKDFSRLKRALRNVNFIHNKKERESALKKYPIIISSAGMLGGGPAVYYLEKMRRRAESKVIFTGYLVEGTPGHSLVNKKRFQNHEKRFDVACRVEQYNFSAHADKRGLEKIIDRCNPKKIICVHGDSTKEYAASFGEKAFAPKNGQKVVL